MDTKEYILDCLDKIAANKNIHLEAGYNSAYICLVALEAYIHNKFDEALQYFSDASVILKSDKAPESTILYEFILGYLNYNEKNTTYSLHYNNARRCAKNSNNEDF